MSRKSDINECLSLWTSGKCEVSEAIAAAHDLGRARGREDTYNGSVSFFENFDAFTKRLRAKVRKAVRETE